MKRLLLACLFPIATFAQTQPIDIVIQNPSFEAPVPIQYQRACGAYTYSGYLGGTFPGGWESTGTVAVIVPIVPRPCDFSNSPDGKQFLVIQNGSISQDLGDIYTLLPHNSGGDINGFYTVHFWVANYFYWYNGKFSVSLILKPNSSPRSPMQQVELCKTSGWAMGDFVDAAFICTAQRKYGELFIMLASGNGTGEYCANCYENLFDNVSLTFTPTN